VLLWEDTARKSPNKFRAHFHLAFAYYEQGRHSDAIAEFERAARIETPNYNMLVDWGLAHDALGQPDQAIARFRQAAHVEPTAHVHTQIAMVYAKRSQWDQALAELAAAEKLDPSFAATYLYRGKVYLKTNMPSSAVASYERAAALDPKSAEARNELEMARQMLHAQNAKK
jgi:protein O-mannosyl-transferase